MKTNGKILIGIALLFINSAACCWAQENKISDILSKAEKINSIYFETTETIAETPNFPQSFGDAIERTKIWFKKDYSRKEIMSESANAKKVIQVSLPKGVEYIYNSYSNKTEKFDWGPSFNSRFLELELKLTLLKKNKSLKVLGTETAGDKMATVLEIIYDLDGKEQKEKYWIWNDKGVPLKTETEANLAYFGMDSLKIKIVKEYKNYSFENIPESIFDIANIEEIKNSTIVTKGEDKK